MNDRTWRRWLPRYGLCNGSSAGQVVTPPGMCLLVEYVKVSVCGGDTTWTADEPLHNPYRGGHRHQVRSKSMKIYGKTPNFRVVFQLCAWKRCRKAVETVVTNEFKF